MEGFIDTSDDQGFAMSLLRWWNRFVSAPARALLRKLSSGLPHTTYGGIEIRIIEPEPAVSADSFLGRTIEALRKAEAAAPKAYEDLCKDIKQVILGKLVWRSVPAYQRFQLAAVVPPSVAFDTDIRHYAIWLLYSSGLARGPREARARRDEFLDSLPVEERDGVRDWLSTITANVPSPD